MLTHLMSSDNRQAPRFQDFARARVDELCQLPGFLEDVSKNGCKVRFPLSFEVDTDREYTLTVQPTCRSGIKEFNLMVKPQRVNQKADSFEIGFSVLYSPGTKHLRNYIEVLAGLGDPELQEA